MADSTGRRNNGSGTGCDGIGSKDARGAGVSVTACPKRPSGISIPMHGIGSPSGCSNGTSHLNRAELYRRFLTGGPGNRPAVGGLGEQHPPTLGKPSSTTGVCVISGKPGPASRTVPFSFVPRPAGAKSGRFTGPLRRRRRLHHGRHTQQPRGGGPTDCLRRRRFRPRWPMAAARRPTPGSPRPVAAAAGDRDDVRRVGKPPGRALNCSGRASRRPRPESWPDTIVRSNLGTLCHDVWASRSAAVGAHDTSPTSPM